MKRLYAIALAATMTLSAGAAHAVTLWSNLPGTSSSGASINTSGQNAAMGFSVPTGVDYIIDELVLTLSRVNNDTPLIRLFSDSGNNPGTALMTFTNPVFSSNSRQQYTFTPSANTVLSAGSAYWIVVQSSGGSYRWHRDNPSVTPTGVFSWIGTRFNGNPPTSPAGGFKYNVGLSGHEVAPIPLPASALLLLGGLGMLKLRARRKA